MSKIKPDYKAGFDALWILFVEMRRKLISERDEARREVCDRAVADYLVDGTIKYDNSGKWRKVARERGWDFEQEALL